MKYLLLSSLVVLSTGLYGQVESPDESNSKKTESTVGDAATSDSSSVPGVMIGVGVLPGHTLRREGFISMPIRIQVMGVKLFKGFGLFGAVEFAGADAPFMDNSSDPADPTTWPDSYFRHMLGIQYSFGKFGAYAGMDMFSKNGFFRSVGEGGTIGTGRKTLGVTYNAYKGLTVSLDFSAYAGPTVGVNYLVPLNGLK